MFTYCLNNPVNYKDPTGNVAETVFDVVTLGFSIVEVIANPTDFWAWAGLVGDVVDVAVPFVGGVGEVIKAAKYVNKAAEVVDTVHDVNKVVDNSADIAKVATTGSPNTIGKIGEQLVGIDVSAKVPILVNGRTRIPDAMTCNILTEVKNVKYISNTQQLRDFAQFAGSTGRTLELYVRPTTRVAKTVLEAGWDIKYLW